jgi:hypothetical protein
LQCSGAAAQNSSCKLARLQFAATSKTSDIWFPMHGCAGHDDHQCHLHGDTHGLANVLTRLSFRKAHCKCMSSKVRSAVGTKVLSKACTDAFEAAAEPLDFSDAGQHPNPVAIY